MAQNLDPEGLETRNFPKICSDNFHEKCKSFILVAFMVSVQSRKINRSRDGEILPIYKLDCIYDF